MLNIDNKNFCEFCFEEIPAKVKKCPYCNGEPNIIKHPTALPENTILNGRYIVGKVLGKGGFGITYLCYDPKEKKKVAIKEYLPDSLAHRNSGETAVTAYEGETAEHFQNGAEKFYEEAKLVARFNGNPNIISVYEFFYENNTTYFVMEYLSGMDMKHYWLKNNKRIPVGEILYIAKRAAEALMIVHSTETLHRDISPDNIFLCDNGDVKLIDFGAARHVVADVSKSLSVILKHGFAPLEQYQRRGKQGPWTDIYALGATMYVCLTGIVPDDAMSRLDEETLDMDGIDPELAAVLMKMMAVRAENRYQNILDVKTALAALDIPVAAPHLAKQTAKNFCTKCGAEIPAGETLCEQCRKPVNDPSVTKTKQSTILKIGAACAAVVILFTSIALIAGNRNNTDIDNHENNNSSHITSDTTGNQNGIDGKLPTINGIQLSDTEVVLEVGESITLTAEITSDIAMDRSIKWASENKDVAIIDSDGVIVAMSIGTTKVTATVDDITASCTVTVKAKTIPVNEIKLDKTEIALKTGESSTLICTILPSDATDQAVTWTSSNTEIATVTDGKISALKPGQATVTATTSNGKTATCMVTVAGLTAINIPSSEITLDAGNTYKFEGITIAGYQTDILTGDEKKVTLTSSDNSIVSVTGHTITALKSGTVTITFSVPGGAQNTCKVTVKEVAVTGISLNKTSLTITHGNTETLYATVSPNNASNKTVTWSSSNTNVVTVSAGGMITAVGEGNATITAKAGNASVQCTVTVTPKAKVIAEGQCGDNVYWGLDELGTLTISGSGEMEDFETYADTPWIKTRDGIKTIIIKNGITSIGDNAFNGCYNLTSITIPNSVTSIGNYAFDGCTSLTSIIIPNSVTSIGDDAFRSCDSLTSITIPASVTSIGKTVFFYCPALTGVTVDPNNPNYCSDKDGVLFSKDKSTLIYFPLKTGRSQTAYEIPYGVATIAPYAFSDCTALKEIIIPNSVETISKGGFEDCDNITSIILPNSISIIGDYSFASCSNLKSITIPNSVTNIGNDAFYECTSLASITIPDSVTSIGSGAFEGCTSLTSITIPDSVTSIGDFAFQECTSLTSITIPDSVTSIGNYAFDDCTSLASITIPDRVTSIGSSAFDGCTSLTSITIPDRVTSIGNYAFDDCDNLKTIIIENKEGNVTIGSYAFPDGAKVTYTK